MLFISLANQIYSYTIEHQNRKTLQIKMIAKNTLQVKAPKNISAEEIPYFLQEKANWIVKQNTCFEFPNNNKENSRTDLVNGTKLLFKGNLLTLNLTFSLRKPSVRVNLNQLLVNLYESHPVSIDTLLRKWYLKQASIVLKEKTTFWGKKLRVTIHRITIKDQKTRWGSCSSLGNINYNWRIIMAPEETMDYLVIHELSHRVFLNHSKDFWLLVKTHCPNYIDHQLWLKENSYLMMQTLPKTN
ncbi:M48 family metallopeptidase [Anaerosinus massiliensis]|uniref:M48 family metallopeptidase n=1 Tax=Massilibacillus massiliensis TaxID=1806837 RepID=UPI000A976252|nr:SprT family zinc-dependent metalloprotease [Massilibacillus massiliensis]